jgi:fimbrial chaperone protein
MKLALRQETYNNGIVDHKRGKTMPYAFFKSSAALLLTLQCSLTLAASLEISPVSISLSGAENGKAMTLRNEGDQPIHAQVRTFAWDQADDADKLTPTRDLIASPPIAEVPAGGQQVIRVIRANSAPVQEERAYRLIIDELPPEGGDTGTAIQFRFRYSVPLFISPLAGVKAGAPVLRWSVAEKEKQLMLRVANSGNVHAQLSAVTLRTPAGDTPVSGGLLGYVLPGRTRSWALKNAPPSLKGASGDVNATVNGVSVKASLSNGDER